MDEADPTPAHSGYIYYLADPRVGEPRYVGWTVNPKQRLRNHLKDAKLGNRCHRNAWIRKLLREGVKPTMSILEEDPADCCEAERWWIRKMREAGYRLTNQTDGGDGAPGYRHTPETKALLRAMFAGKTLSSEHRAAISAGGKGRKVSPEGRANISRALKGKPKSPEHIAKMAATKTGIPQSPERAAQSRGVGRAALIKLNKSAEHRARVSAHHRGKTLSAEHRAKIGAARLGKKYPAASAARKGKPLAAEHRAKVVAGLGLTETFQCPHCGREIKTKGNSVRHERVCLASQLAQLSLY